jgi:membrane protein YqaA with SNARE-associated domain
MPLAAAWLATFAWCLASAFIPVVNAELYLLAASAAAPRAFVAPLVVAAALGQMVGKTAMYFAGRGALRLPGKRVNRALAEIQAKFRGHRAIGSALLFTSAAAGLPPFYVVSVACGVLRVELARFVALGLAGRLLRFALIVLGPQLVKG